MFLNEDGVRQSVFQECQTWVYPSSILSPSPFPSPGRSGVRVNFFPFCRETSPYFYSFTPSFKDFMKSRISLVRALYLPQSDMDCAMNHPASSEGPQTRKQRSNSPFLLRTGQLGVSRIHLSRTINTTASGFSRASAICRAAVFQIAYAK